jgi:hypothetical protein
MERNATVSFEFGWRVEVPHLFDIVEVKEETYRMALRKKAVLCNITNIVLKGV